MSFLRSTIWMKPSSSTRARSPVRSQPSDEGRRGLLGLVPVAGHHVLAPDQQLADPRGSGRPRRGRAPRPAPAKPDRLGPRLAVLVRQEGGHRRGLGEPEAVAEPCVGEAALESAMHRSGAWAPRRRSAQRTSLTSKSAKLRLVHAPASRWPAPSVSTLIRSSAMAWRNGLHLERRHDHRAVPPTSVVTSSWLLQPVTWNIGTEIRLRSDGPGAAARSPAGSVLAVGQEVLVRGHGALREARGAAGVEDRREVLPAAGRRPRTARRRAAATPGSQHDARRRESLHHVLDLGLGEARVDRARRRPPAISMPKKAERPVDCRCEPDGDPVAPLDPGAAQAAGHAGRAVPQLLVGQPRHHRAPPGPPPTGPARPRRAASPPATSGRSCSAGRRPVALHVRHVATAAMAGFRPSFTIIGDPPRSA